MKMLDDLYLPNGKSLHKVVVGQSGSGKTYFLEKTSQSFLRTNQDENFRMVYFSPKNEGFADNLAKGVKPVTTVEAMVKSMATNTLTVFYPDATGLEDTMDETIDALFSMKDLNPNMRATLVIDDAQVFLSARKEASESQRRLALLGRSRELNAIYVSHGLVMNKALEAQVQSLTFFTIPNPIHFRSAIERYGFDPEPFVEKLKEREYSFVMYDVRRATANLMNPIGAD